MKKKLGIILLALMILAALAACDHVPDDMHESDEKIAIEVYKDIVQRFSFFYDNMPGAFDVDTVLKADIGLLDYDMSIVIDSNIRIICDGQQTQIVVYTHTDMRDFGNPPFDADMYVMMDSDTVVDFLMFANGEDITGLVPVESIDNMLTDELNNINNYPEFDETAIRSVSIDTVGNTTVISLLLYSDILGEWISDVMEGYTTMLNEFGVELEANVADLLITIETDRDGNPPSMEFDMLTRLIFPDDLTGELEEFSGEEMHISMIIHYVYNSFGDDVEIIWAEAGSRPVTQSPAIPELLESFPDPTSRTILVPEDPDKLDVLIEFLEAFDLITSVITDHTGRQELSVFPSPGSLERIDMFFSVTGIEIDLMEIMQSGTAVYIKYLEITAEQRAEFLKLVAGS